MQKPRFSWGDAVRVKSSAPADMHAGRRGEVVAVTTFNTQEKVDAYGVSVGGTVYQVEFGDGSTVEIEEGQLESDRE